MTYGEFRERCQKSEAGKIIWELWMMGKIPLIPAMDLLIKFGHFGQLSLL